jgi:PAT family beta-lactamase induction signal transducer AmpG
MSYVFYLLPAQLREAGHPAEAISAVSLVYLPYALRVFWAPAIDGYATRRQGSGSAHRYKTAIVVSLVVAVATVLAFRLVDPINDLGGIMLVSAALFVVLATGTTGLDGYAVATLDTGGRERASIWQTVGFTLGGIALGGIAAFSSAWSWPFLTLVIAAATTLMALPVLALPAARPVPATHASGAALPQQSATEPLWKSRSARRLLLLTLLTKLGIGMVAGYLPILQVDHGVPAAAAGFFGAIGSNVLGLAVAIASGFLLLKFGGAQTIGAMNLLGALIFAFAALFHQAFAGPVFAVGVSIAFLSLGYAYVAPFKALSLAVSDGRMAASRAAVFASIDLTLAIVVASLSGSLVSLIGLGAFFWTSMVLCLAAAAAAFLPAGRSGVPILSSTTEPLKGLAAK